MKKAIFTLAALLVSGSAFAQAYVGIAGGASKQDVNCDGLTSCDKSDTGFKVYAGYKFAPFIAGELTYTDFGKVKANYFTVSARYQTTSIAVGVAGFIPFGPQLTGVARLGVASNKAKSSASLGGASSSDSETNTQPYVGLGLGWEVARAVSLNAAFDLTKSEYGSEKSNATLLSVGVSYAF